MQILQFQKNSNHSTQSTKFLYEAREAPCTKSQNGTQATEQRCTKILWTACDGFTLLECILAVGVLALAISSIVALQSSIISTTRMAVNKMQASWAIRSAMEQVQYILDVQGQAFIPETVSFPWEGDNSFVTTVTRKDLNEIKPSQFLLSALKVSNATDPSANQNLDLDRTMAPIASMMDSSVGTLKSKASSGVSAPTSAQSYFCNVIITAAWGEGTQKQSLSDGLFLIDDNVLSNFKPPNSKSGSAPSENPQTPPQTPPQTGPGK